MRELNGQIASTSYTARVGCVIRRNKDYLLHGPCQSADTEAAHTASYVGRIASRQVRVVAKPMHFLFRDDWAG